MTGPAPVSRQRIDKWLFFARLAKSRTLAQEWVEAGHVTLNGEKARRPSTELKIGDRLEISISGRLTVVVVKAPGARRGPYEQARLLYEDLSPPPERLTAYEKIVRDPGTGRPEKKERRQIERLKGRYDFDG